MNCWPYLRGHLPGSRVGCAACGRRCRSRITPGSPEENARTLRGVQTRPRANGREDVVRGELIYGLIRDCLRLRAFAPNLECNDHDPSSYPTKVVNRRDPSELTRHSGSQMDPSRILRSVRTNTNSGRQGDMLPRNYHLRSCERVRMFAADNGEWEVSNGEAASSKSGQRCSELPDSQWARMEWP
ncbi:hypothetical protein KM043_016251 [Ampulex compressa]|nr:hypothetical protein KM043_016251 [Ampulex compressa]